MAGKYSIQIKGTTALVKLLGGGGLPIETMHRLVSISCARIARAARARAPGTLASGISVSVERVPGDFLSLTRAPYVRGRVTVEDRRNRGFRYPWALDASKKIKYRDRRTGRLTKNWFRSSKRGESRYMRTRLDQELIAHLRGR